MQSDPRAFKAPFIEPQRCWEEADKFRHQYWPSGEIPVDVLAIVEFDLNLEIRTIQGLKEDADIDALLLGDWKTIIVDQRQMLSDMEQKGLLRENLTDAHIAYVCIPLAKRFAVSQEVIEKRLQREKLWPLQ